MEVFLYICGSLILLLVIAVVTRVLTALPKLRKSNETIFDHEIFHNRGE